MSAFSSSLQNDFRILISNWFERGEKSLFLSVNLYLKVKISSLLPKHPLWQWKLSSPKCNLTRMWQSPPVYAITASLKQMTRVLSQCCWTFILRDLSYWKSAGLCMCASHLASYHVLHWWCTNPVLFHTIFSQVLLLCNTARNKKGYFFLS